MHLILIEIDRVNALYLVISLFVNYSKKNNVRYKDLYFNFFIWIGFCLIL
jgi:hypothetical protein